MNITGVFCSYEYWGPLEEGGGKVEEAVCIPSAQRVLRAYAYRGMWVLDGRSACRDAIGSSGRGTNPERKSGRGNTPRPQQKSSDFIVCDNLLRSESFCNPRNSRGSYRIERLIECSELKP